MKNQKSFEKYKRENCEICNNRFTCKSVEEFDENNKKDGVLNCQNFDDVYTH